MNENTKKTAKIKVTIEGAVTIGETIDALVERFGSYSTGIYILERALTKSIGARDIALIQVDGKLIQEFEKYQQLRREEGAALKARVS